MNEPFEPLGDTRENWELPSSDPLSRRLEALDRELTLLTPNRAHRVPLPPGAGPQRGGHGSRRGLSWLTGAGLAAALLVGIALFARSPEQPMPSTLPLNVSADRPFVVFQTRNPDLAIVWLLDDKENQP